MTTAAPVVPVDAVDVVERVVAVLRSGGVVVLPTDTVYGVAALPTDAAAVDAVFAMKGRHADVPMAVLCADAAQALDLAEPSAAQAVRSVTDRWWPGPLTLVLPRRPGLGYHLGQPDTTVGLRVPDHPLVHAVTAAAGPIATTSANRHGAPTATTAAEAAAALGAGVGLVVDGGGLEGRSSTVLDAVARPWRVLREGPIPADALLIPDR
jgi:tRNA threonylcarbamoyl adenosine modification protein (Sua5/YciO/YrdC/YwlC family)